MATGISPTAIVDVPPTPVAELDAALETLRSRAAAWCETGVAERIDLLAELTERTIEAAPAWVVAASRVKGIDADSPLMGEEWATAIMPVLWQLKGFETSLRDVLEHGRPMPRMRVRANGQVEARVLPADWIDRLTLTGFSIDVRLQHGVTQAQAEERIGRIYRPGYVAEPTVACVLGAGNVGSIPVLDVLYQLFALDRVAVLKMSPVNAHIGPHVAEVLEPLVAGGFVRIVYGGTDVADHLVTHDHVEAVHLTGSRETHDAIVFGTGDEGRARRESGEPRIDAVVTSELGNVSPVIVVPGPWRDGDLAYHGDNLATMLVNNAGFNCAAARVIVQHRAWSKRRALLDAVRDSLRRAEPRPAYYPGARERWERFVEAHRTAEWFGDDTGGNVPYTLIPELDPLVDDDIAFTDEVFCGLFAEVALDAPRSVPEFVDAAVAFCNDTLAGTLSATLLVHPSSMRDPLVAEAVDRAVDDLRYGSVSINHWTGVTFGAASASWGGYPGGTLADPGSGIGVVHNSYLLEDVEKSVLRGPFRTPQVPGWFHTNRRMHELWHATAYLTAARRPIGLAGLAWNSLRG